jgi:hypothetical protein
MPSDPMETIVNEIVSHLPVTRIYNDVGSGAVNQLGEVLTDIVKTLRLALAPLQFTAAFQDRLVRFIDRSVRRVPNTQRISPPTQMLGPIIEGVRYEPEGTSIDRMFSQLLSRSIDRERIHEAHPSFPLIIKQLSSDEANILTVFKDGNFGITKRTRLGPVNLADMEIPTAKNAKLHLARTRHRFEKEEEFEKDY